MARWIYEWKPTKHGQRLFRRPGSAPVPKREKPRPDYEALKKPELVAIAGKRNLNASGTKADIIGRLEAADGR